MKTKAIVFTGPNEVDIGEFNMPPCGPKEVIAETIYSFVSPGTELRVLAGVKESKDKFPLIPGYSWVGRIIERGAEARGFANGDLVSGRNPLPLEGVNTLWGGQASHHRAPVAGYDAVLKLPQGADPWEYITVEVGAISWRGTSIAFPAKGETAIVLGQGLIGAFAACWLMHHGCRVIVTDLEASRLERARSWGVAAAINGRADDAREQILAFCDEGADIVIEASSSIAGARLASTLLRQPQSRRLNQNYDINALRQNPHAWPRLVFLANYTDSISESHPAGLLRTEGAIVYKPGDRCVGDRLAVMDRIREGALNTNDIVSELTPVDRAPEAYAALREHPERHSAFAFKW